MTTEAHTRHAARPPTQAPSVRDRARWFGLAGVGYVVGIQVGDDTLAGEAPVLDATRADVAAYLAEPHGTAREWLGRLIALAGVGLLAVFFARLYAALRASRSTWLPELVLGAGLVAVAVHFTVYGPHAAIAVAPDNDFGVEASQLAFLAASALFVLWWIPAAIALLGTAAVVLRERILPAWFGWLTLLQGLAFISAVALLSVSLAGLLAYVLFWLWLVTASIVLVRHREA